MQLPNKVHSSSQTWLFVGTDEGAVASSMVAHAQGLHERVSGASEPAGAWAQTHPALHWMRPGGQTYRRDDLEPFFEEVYRSRGENSPIFYLFTRADLLNESSANSMLKVLEEPPPATYCLLGTPCLDFVLPTIVSRSQVVPVSGSMVAGTSLLISHFLGTMRQSYAPFMKLLESEEIDERKTRVLLDMLSSQAQDAFRRAVLAQDAAECRRIERLQRIIGYGYEHLPMPGSSKSFWRTLYLLVG
ncbi:MAG: hypothetical protein M1549_01645 [Candidatus Dependentiae bacterium]|nr:hypothetical protein [Candidatus Dependentiae bacterium]